MPPLADLPPPVAALLRAALFRMVAYVLVGAASSWLYAQVALRLMVHLGFDRKWVGITAVAVAILVPIAGSAASYGTWWWKPRPLRRLWQTLRRSLTRRRVTE